jgi:hypothetical protein
MLYGTRGEKNTEIDGRKPLLDALKLESFGTRDMNPNNRGIFQLERYSCKAEHT